MNEIYLNTRSLLSDGKWTAGVIGLGYVGLPLLVSTVTKGLAGIGFDVSTKRITDLSSGKSHIDDISDADLAAAAQGDIKYTANPNDLAKADVIFICVPSPLGRNRQPDLSFIEAASETVARIARPGQVVSLESTTYPGTTEDYLVPAVKRAGLTLDEDVFVAFSPERVSPGDDMKTAEIPKVVGGVTPKSGELAAAAYRRIVPAVHVVSSARVAELSKLLENTYRAVNIGLVNEMAQLAHELGIDIWEAVEAAATKPFGFQAFWPGPGVGGHCIPLDPQYLSWRAREANFATRFIDLAEQVNSKMPSYNASRIADVLNGLGKAVHGSRILVIGVAYKSDIADDRESAAYDVIAELSRRGAIVEVLDPVVGAERIKSRGLIPSKSLEGYDLAAILTDHSTIDYRKVSEEVPVVFDARGVYRRLRIEVANVVAL